MYRRKWFAAPALAALLVCACVAARAQAQVVNFESYPEGFLDFTFTDPSTGVFFFDGRRQGDPVIFAIENGGPPPGLPGWFFGNWLAGGGFAPGPGPSMPANFGFSARFPQSVSTASLDVTASLISAGGSVTLEGLNAGGSVVATTSHPVTGFTGQTFAISVTSPAGDIRSIRLVPNNVFDVADNIAIPEPSCGAVIIASLASLMARRGRRLSA
jgi:hypothetical protein